ncbi:taurine catabolism dioxygenase [Marmoricola sp. Leaf446]|uniref:TauD/TfdA dioxygenase family protein n=1 Tax=Marmoricola sp. Leaf446 TaxID=1736379 RepID=UPI0006F5199C|nr:TauD/TfdA family dioxygenase [Marmoricola sp. Leaf446]KQT90818.1 taurine catabolism dioxygenase [Marmoricola sp. Leaf446]
MRTTATEPVGVEVTDLDLREVSDAEVEQLRLLLAERGVAVFPGQDVDDESFVAFLRRFGDLAFTVGETPVEGCPDLNLISNVGRTTPPRSQFHVDSSYLRVPPAYTALRTVTIPDEGGETLFTNQYVAHDTLPADLREQLEGRRITHVVTGLDLDDDEETQAQHPVFRPHPVTGRPALYLSTAARCASISGMDEAETQAVVARLLEHSTRPENTLRHAWSPGDVVMWDNAVVMHKADHSGVVGDRVMHRGMVAGHGSEAGSGEDHPGW